MKFHILGREALKKKARTKKKVQVPKVAEKTVDVHSEMVPPTEEEHIDVKYNSVRILIGVAIVFKRGSKSELN